MKVQSPDELYRTLQAGRRGGRFFVFGDEEYLKEEAVAALISAHIEPATRDFNLDQLRASETPPETLASIVATPPLLAEWRVVILRDAQAWAGAARARATLEALLGRNTPGLLFIVTAQIPGRAQFYDNLRRLATAVECKPLSESDIAGWLMERAAARDVQLDPDAARDLANAMGFELGVLVQELAKLIEFVGDRRHITRADVHAVAGRVQRMSRWDWFDLVGDRKFREARVALPVLLDSGENGVGLVIGLGTQFLRLGIGTAGGPRALESALPQHQKWLAGRLAKQARGWSAAVIDRVLDDLLRADRLLKSTSLTDRQVLEELLLRMQTHVTDAAA
ncbi:MAG: DNA polymerase III subunit delta [Longimicrobiales bacterium]